MVTGKINELRKLAEPLVPWCVTSAWEGEEGTAWLGNISYDDNLHEVACFDLTMYDGFEGDSLKMAQYYAAANPAAILALIQQRDELLAALNRILSTPPGQADGGGFVVDHFDGDGEYIGSQGVDPMWVVQEMASVANAAIAKAEAQS